MELKSCPKVAVILGALILTSNFTTPSTARADKDTFVKLKCSKCHSIDSIGLAKVSDGAGDEDEDGEDGKDSPDLSHVGKEHDAAYLKDFLAKKVEHKPHAGNDNSKKHKSKFKGSEEDLEKVSNWLATLK